jgi:hypothetical protein
VGFIRVTRVIGIVRVMRVVRVIRIIKVTRIIRMIIRSYYDLELCYIIANCGTGENIYGWHLWR